MRLIGGISDLLLGLEDWFEIHFSLNDYAHRFPSS